MRLVLLVVAIAVVSVGSPRAAAENPPAAVRQASFERAPANDGSQTVHFNRRAPQVGDQLEQTVTVELKLDSLARQGNQVIERAKTAVVRHQRRIMTSSEISGGMPVAAIVRYLEATKQTAAGEREADLTRIPITRQPVHDKTYRCRREGEKLKIVDGDGHIPPLDEFEIVAENMDTLGRVNPLAQFLAGQSVSVGQQISLPHDVAEKLLGLGDEMGEVTRFDLTLRDVRPVDGATCAVFDASIEAASSRSSQMRLVVDGPLVIQVDTCRAVDANFIGPIGMSGTRGSLSETYQIAGTGRITIAIHSLYRNVQP